MGSKTRTTWAGLAALVVLATLDCGPATPPPDDPPERASAVRLERLARDVFVALQPADERFDDSNSVVVLRERDVVVIDAQADAAFVRGVIEGIRALTDRPVGVVINTHWHADHTQGNALYREEFGDGVRILGHRSLIEDIPERATQAEAIEQARTWLVEHRDTVFVAPDETYDDERSLTEGGQTIRLIHVRAHTRGDTVVHLPEAGILITGDVLDDLPYVGHGYPGEWIAALDRLGSLEFDRIVPGHGPVFHGREQLEGVRGFLAALVSGEADLSEWRERLARDDAGRRFFDAVLDEAIERARLEAAGELAELNRDPLFC